MALYFRTNDGVARKFDGLSLDVCQNLLTGLGLQYQQITEAEFNHCTCQGA